MAKLPAMHSLQNRFCAGHVQWSKGHAASPIIFIISADVKCLLSFTPLHSSIRHSSMDHAFKWDIATICALQSPNGGLRDKPGKPPDYYHTCYCLSGLSASQHYGQTVKVLGDDLNRLAKIDLLCNVVADQLQDGLAYFDNLDNHDCSRSHTSNLASPTGGYSVP